MPTTKAQQDFITAMQNYAEQLVVEAYSRTRNPEDEPLSDEVLAELADAVERQLFAEATRAVESAVDPIVSTEEEFVQPIGTSKPY